MRTFADTIGLLCLAITILWVGTAVVARVRDRLTQPHHRRSQLGNVEGGAGEQHNIGGNL